MKKQTDWGIEAGKHAVLILGALVVILPFYLMISFSFKSPSEDGKCIHEHMISNNEIIFFCI